MLGQHGLTSISLSGNPAYPSSERYEPMRGIAVCANWMRMSHDSAVTLSSWPESLAQDRSRVERPTSRSGLHNPFRVESEFLVRYPIQQAGGKTILELWVPAEELDDFNAPSGWTDWGRARVPPSGLTQAVSREHPVAASLLDPPAEAPGRRSGRSAHRCGNRARSPRGSCPGCHTSRGFRSRRRRAARLALGPGEEEAHSQAVGRRRWRVRARAGAGAGTPHLAAAQHRAVIRHRERDTREQVEVSSTWWADRMGRRTPRPPGPRRTRQWRRRRRRSWRHWSPRLLAVCAAVHSYVRAVLSYITARLSGKSSAPGAVMSPVRWREQQFGQLGARRPDLSEQGGSLGGRRTPVRLRRPVLRFRRLHRQLCSWPSRSRSSGPDAFPMSGPSADGESWPSSVLMSGQRESSSST